MNGSTGKAHRILIAFNRRDAELADRLLDEAQISHRICKSMRELCHEITAGAGAVLLMEEMIDQGRADELKALVDQQPSWSDLPIILLTSNKMNPELAATAMEKLGNITLLERPITVKSFLSVVRASLKARRRQYEIRDEIENRQRITEQLRLSQAHLRRLAESDFVGVMRADASGSISDANDAFLKIMGYTREDLGEGRMRWIEMTPKDYLPLDYRAIEEANMNGSCKPYEKEFIRKDGSRVPILIGFSRLEGPKEDYICLIWDLTERKQFEESLRASQMQLIKQAEDLWRTNQELEQFAYVSSHDLKEPLRKISVYAQLLATQLKSENGDIKHYVDNIVGGAKRMYDLIEDLLAYSRINKQDLTPVDASLSEILHQALSDLEVAITDRKAEVTWDELPTVKGNRPELRQLLQNLINNAIKFNNNAVPKVHISAERQQDGWVVSVRDNGIGIESKYHEHIFQVFSRLHSKEKFAGTGIGLAICKKIVERHGGKIWIESVPGAGSTFFIKFPFLEQQDSKNPTRAGVTTEALERR